MPTLLQVLITPRTPAAEARGDYIENDVADVANDIAEFLGAIGDTCAVEHLMACFTQYVVTAPPGAGSVSGRSRRPTGRARGS